MYTADVRQAVVRHAIAAARAHQNGETDWQGLDLAKGGMCARFVRQVYEKALGMKPFAWQYAAPSARDMATKLRHAGALIDTGDRRPGDVVQIGTGYPGHVALYVGEVDGVESIAENTSDASRGRPRVPGTKITPWSAVSSRVTGVFRLCANADAAEEPTGIKLILQEGDTATVLTDEGVLVDGVLMVPARKVGEAMGRKVTDHIKTQGKAYWS